MINGKQWIAWSCAAVLATSLTACNMQDSRQASTSSEDLETEVSQDAASVPVDEPVPMDNEVAKNDTQSTFDNIKAEMSEAGEELSEAAEATGTAIKNTFSEQMEKVNEQLGVIEDKIHKAGDDIDQSVDDSYVALEKRREDLSEKWDRVKNMTSETAQETQVQIAKALDQLAKDIAALADRIES